MYELVFICHAYLTKINHKVLQGHRSHSNYSEKGKDTASLAEFVFIFVLKHGVITNIFEIVQLKNSRTYGRLQVYICLQRKKTCCFLFN